MKNSKQKSGWGVLCTMLSILLAVQLCIACFVRPGWLAKGERVGTDIEQQQENAAVDDFVIDQTSSPGNPALIDVTYTQDDIMAAPTDQAAVSPSAPSAMAGVVTVSFPSWDLRGEDTLNVRTLPEKIDSATGEKLRAYDLSLISGQHEFATNMTVRIPRTAGDKAGRVLWLNPETESWEPLIFRVSEDGMFYDVYLDHFSVIAEGVNEYVERANGALFRIEKLDRSGEPYPKLQEPVAFNEEEAVNMLACDLAGVDAIENDGSIPPDTALTNAMALLNTGVGYADTLNTVLKLDSALSDSAKLGLQKTTAGVGTALTVARVCYQLSKSDDPEAVIKENSLDIAGSVAGVAGAAAATAGAAGTAAALSYVGAGIVVYSAGSAMVDALPDSPVEAAYWSYMNHKLTDIDGEYTTLRMNDAKWADALRAEFKKHEHKATELNSAIEALYDSYVNDFWTALTPEGRKAYYDILREEELELARKDPEAAKWKLIGFNKPYAEPDEAARKALIERARGKVIANSKSILASITETYMVESMRECVKEVENEILPYLNQYVTINVRDKGLEKGQRFSESPYASFEGSSIMYKKEAPFSLLPEYAEMWSPDSLDIAFEDTKPIGFWPSNTTVDDYNPTQIIPHSMENSDTIFACRMYNYIQIGSPTKVLFKGDGTDKLKDYHGEFKLPKNKGNYIDAYIEIDRLPEPTTVTTTADARSKCSYRLDTSSLDNEDQRGLQYDLINANIVTAAKELIQRALADAVITPDSNGEFVLGTSQSISASGNYDDLLPGEENTHDGTVECSYSYSSGNILIEGEIDPKGDENSELCIYADMSFDVLINGHDGEETAGMRTNGSANLSGKNNFTTSHVQKEIDGKTYDALMFEVLFEMKPDYTRTPLGELKDEYSVEKHNEKVNFTLLLEFVSTEPIS